MAGLQLFTNNASSTLAADITNVATSISLSPGTGALFPSITGSDYFYVTIVNGGGTKEIVKVTARSTDTLTVVRGQEGTTGTAYSTGDVIELRPTAAGLTNMVQKDGAQTLTEKTLQAATFTNGYTEETVTTNTGTSYTIDLANGTVQILTLTGNCTYTFPANTAGTSFLLVQKQDGTGSRTVTWDSDVKWPSSTAPTITSTASKADVFAFTCDGTYWYGRVIGQNYL